MSDILQLHHYVLEMIFKKLSREERLKCKEVCKQWYEYFMEPLNFREDRTIYIEYDSQVDEMVSILAAAKGSYEKLVIVDLKENEDFVQLGNFLRDNGFKEVCFKNFQPRHANLLPELKFIESLSFEGIFFPNFRKCSLEIFFFENIKKVAVTNNYANFKNIDKWIKNEFPVLRKLIPKDAEIHFKVLSLWGPKWLPHINEALKALDVKFELIKVELNGNTHFKKEEYLELRNCRFQHLDITYPDMMPIKFEELLNIMENLREVKICIGDFSILRELSLENLTKITELDILGATCKSNHDSFSCPSLLKLMLFQIDCGECFEAILNNYMPKLRKLRISAPPPSVILRQKIEVIHWTFNTLELSVDAIKKIDKLCPKLETFKLSRFDKVNSSSSLEDLRDALTNGFENLKKFRIGNYEDTSKLELTKEDGVVQDCNFKDGLNVNNAKRRKTKLYTKRKKSK